MNEYQEDYERLINVTIPEALNSLAQVVSKFLMDFSKEDKTRILSDQPESILNRVFVSAFQREDYEVCQVVKEILAKR
mgnify:CR=1 FL=1